MTQQALAEWLGTDAGIICNLERSDRSMSATWLHRLAPALKTTPGAILDFKPEDLEPEILTLWAKIPAHRQSEARLLLALMATT